MLLCNSVVKLASLTHHGFLFFCRISPCFTYICVCGATLYHHCYFLRLGGFGSRNVGELCAKIHVAWLCAREYMMDTFVFKIAHGSWLCLRVHLVAWYHVFLVRYVL